MRKMFQVLLIRKFTKQKNPCTTSFSPGISHTFSVVYTDHAVTSTGSLFYQWSTVVLYYTILLVTGLEVWLPHKARFLTH